MRGMSRCRTGSQRGPVWHADAVAECIADTPLWQLRRIAVDYAGLLMPRWPTNPCFWPDLVRFAAAVMPRRLATAQLLGSQLIAAELELARRTQHRTSRVRRACERAELQLRARMR